MKSATRRCGGIYEGVHFVSIHALNEECDMRQFYLSQVAVSFNPRTQWRVRPVCFLRTRLTWCFNPRTQWRVRPLRLFRLSNTVPFCFNPRTQWRVRQKPQYVGEWLFCFNPRTQWRVRLRFKNYSDTPLLFQSTHSMKSATSLRWFPLMMKSVSIHALNEECDNS